MPGWPGCWLGTACSRLGADPRDAIETGVISGPPRATSGNATPTAAACAAGRLIPDESLVGYGKLARSRDETAAQARRQIKHKAVGTKRMAQACHLGPAAFFGE